MRPRVWFDPRHAEHDPGSSEPDWPARIEVCLDAIKDMEPDLIVPTAPPREVLELVHEGSYLEDLEKFASEGGGRLTNDTIMSPGSFDVAARASGAAVNAVESVFDKAGAAFSLTRPPGHHARPSEGMGFCLINHVAVAAQFAIDKGLARRVMIVDFDVHHGNGTQEIFWTSPDVLFVSLHQWPWYPWSTGALQEVGQGPGEGTTVNIPLPAMTGDDVYVDAVKSIVVPVGRHFQPDLILCSAGFDAHERDPLSLQEMTAAGFSAIAQLVKRLADEVCDGRLVSVLEGGYHMDSLKESFAATLSAFTGRVHLGEAGELTQGFPYSGTGLKRVFEFHQERWELPAVQ